MLNKKALLDMLKNFVIYETENNKKVKKIAKKKHNNNKLQFSIEKIVVHEVTQKIIYTIEII